MEQAFAKDSSSFHLNSGIKANLDTGEITDTYGHEDKLFRTEEGFGIKNIIGSSNNDEIIGSNQGSEIVAGAGDDLITIFGGNNKVVGGLGDDRINIEGKNAIIYGDDLGHSGGKDTFSINGEFDNITIEDFETNSDTLRINLRNGEKIEVIEGLGTSNIKLKKSSNNDGFINLNSSAGIITATTLAIATTEVMALTDIVPSVESFTGGQNDILDLSRLSYDLVADMPFEILWEANDQSTLVDMIGYENIIGGSGTDIILGFGDKSFGIIGGDGIDRLYGSELDFLRYDLEEIYRSSGNAAGVEVNLADQEATDTYGNKDIIEGFGNISGTSHDDLLVGDENNNIIQGNDGNDVIFGLAGNDILIGGSGSDVIDGGLGNDTLTGDNGVSLNHDLFVFKGVETLSDFGHDKITDFQVGIDTARVYLDGNDIITQDFSYQSGTKLDISNSSISFDWANNYQFQYDLSSFDFVSSIQEIRSLAEGLENLSGSKAAQGGYDDVVQLSNLGNIGEQGYFIDFGFQEMYDLSSSIETNSDLYDVHDYGNIIGSKGDDIILGSVSHGVGISGGVGDDVLYGNSLDSLRYDLEEELATEELIGSAITKINNHVEINLGNDELKLNDILIDSRSAEDMWGNTDTILGIENAYGTSGNDIIYGSENDNQIYAGNGDDLIYGGSGSDILDGGEGQDTFVFLNSDLQNGSNETDIINNFNVNEDKISFDTLGMDDVNIELFDNEGGADAIISFNDHADWGSIVLVDVGRLDTDDIIIDSGAVVG